MTNQVLDYHMLKYLYDAYDQIKKAQLNIINAGRLSPNERITSSLDLCVGNCSDIMITLLKIEEPKHTD